MEYNTVSTYDRFVTAAYSRLPFTGIYEDLENIFSVLQISGLESVLPCPVPVLPLSRIMCAMAIKILNEQVKRLIDTTFLQRLPYPSDTPLILIQNSWPELLVLGMWQIRSHISFEHALLTVRTLVRQEQIERSNGAAQRLRRRRRAYRTSVNPPEMTPEDRLDLELDEMYNSLLYIHIFYLAVDVLQLTCSEQSELVWFCLYSPHGIAPNIAAYMVSLQTQLADRMANASWPPGPYTETRRKVLLLLLTILKNLSRPFMKAIFFSPNSSTIKLDIVIENLFRFERTRRMQNNIFAS